MQWEFQFLDFLQTVRTPLLDKIMPLITVLGDNGYLWIALAAVLLIRRKDRKTGFIVALALICDLLLCNCLVKPLAARVRPYDIQTAVQLLIKKPTDFSFPSGHTAASFASVGALFFDGRKKMWKIALIPAVLIAFSRMYLYVHYPTDILGGIVIGLLCGWLGFMAGEAILKKYFYTFAGKSAMIEEAKNNRKK